LLFPFKYFISPSCQYFTFPYANQYVIQIQLGIDENRINDFRRCTKTNSHLHVKLQLSKVNQSCRMCPLDYFMILRYSMVQFKTVRPEQSSVTPYAM